MHITVVDLPDCNYHNDCFAKREGRCIALTDTYFKRGYCPFYKSENKLNAERKSDIKSNLKR